MNRTPSHDDAFRQHRPRQARPYALGLAPEKPARRMPYTAADLAWHAQTSNISATDYDVIEPARAWDHEAGEAEAHARLDTGLPLF